MASFIGGPARIGDPSRNVLSPASRMLLDGTAQGLVRFDANGGIEPGLAERWIMIDDGRSVIFRLRDAEWADGQTVTAEQVVPALRRAIAGNSRNPLAPYLTAIDEIVAMTPQVIEVRLSRPRPDILKLFAQPELAITGPDGRGGSGPFRIQPDTGGYVLLRPAFDPQRSPDDEVQEPGPERYVRLRGERASVAILRFVRKESDLVDGGTFTNVPLLNYVEVAPAAVRLDGAAGLFGFVVAKREGFLADPLNRSTIAMLIDRVALTGAIRDGWAPIETLLPEQLDSTQPPSPATWSLVAAADRPAAAAARITTYRTSNPGTITVRIGLPAGPGATILFGTVGAALRRAGIEPVRVDIRDMSADLRLIDAVAPYDSARWYLGAACQPCGEAATAAIIAARDAPTLPERAARIAEADAALASDVAFIPIARPLRWALVAPRLKAWTPNARAFHPLNHLRADPN